MLKSFLRKWLDVPSLACYHLPALTKFEAEELQVLRRQVLAAEQKIDTLASALGVIIVADYMSGKGKAIIAREDSEISCAEAKRRLDLVITGNSFMRALKAVMQNFPSERE